MLNQFLWVIFPYLCLVVFVAGHIARYRYDKFSWAAKSSELIERKRLMWGSLLFHLGIIPVFFGHVVGLLIPKSWMDAVGVSEHLYHIGAVYIGSIFGIITLIGMFLLTARRVTTKSIRRLSSASDIFVNFLLLLIVFMGCYATLVTNIQHPDFNYRTSLSIWFRQLFMLKPDASLMSGVPIAFKMHILLGFTIMLVGHLHVWCMFGVYL